MTGHRFSSNRGQVAARSLPTFQKGSWRYLRLRAFDAAWANADWVML
jgi:hypothetical protein